MDVTLAKTEGISSYYCSNRSNPNFKAKLLIEKMPELNFPRSATLNNNQDPRAMYILQKSIEKFLKLPNDIVVKVTGKSIWPVFTNMKTGLNLKETSMVQIVTGNNFLDEFINMVLSQKEIKETTEGEAFLMLDNNGGKVKTCGDMFKKYKDELVIGAMPVLKQVSEEGEKREAQSSTSKITNESKESLPAKEVQRDELSSKEKALLVIKEINNANGNGAKKLSEWASPAERIDLIKDMLNGAKYLKKCGHGEELILQSWTDSLRKLDLSYGEQKELAKIIVEASEKVEQEWASLSDEKKSN